MDKTMLIIVGGLGGTLFGVALVILIVLPIAEAYSSTIFRAEAITIASVFIALSIGVGGFAMYGILLRMELREREEKLRDALQSNFTKDRFISLVLHHLRTPLSGIKWVLYDLLEDLGDKKSKLREAISRLYEENESALAAVNHLIEAARASVERIEYSFEELKLEDLRNIIQKTAEDMRSRLKQKGISFEVLLPQAPKGAVRVDATKIRIVLQSLLENALDYTTAGGKVSISLKYKKDSVEIIVSDTGIGIPKESLPKIFIEFYRADNARRMKPEGFGVGMFIAKKFIEHHGGNILLESQEGKGTIATVILPMLYVFRGKTDSDSAKTGR